MVSENKNLFGHSSLAIRLNEAIKKGELIIKKNAQPHSRKYNLPDYPPVESIGEDGVDHICLSINGKTDLGRALSPDITLTLNHRLLGQFVSIQAFWTWVRSEKRPGAVRYMSSQELYRFQRNENNKINYRLRNYKAIVMDGCWQLIQSFPEIKEALIESELPFDMHYVDKKTNTRKRPNYAVWYLYGIEEIRKTMKEDPDGRPTFKKLMNEEISDLDTFIAKNFEVLIP